MAAYTLEPVASVSCSLAQAEIEEVELRAARHEGPHTGKLVRYYSQGTRHCFARLASSIGTGLALTRLVVVRPIPAAEDGGMGLGAQATCFHMHSKVPATAEPSQVWTAEK